MKQLKGLILEDDTETRELLEVMLPAALPYDFLFFDNAYDASIAVIQGFQAHSPFDFYLLDLSMREATGFVVAQTVRTWEATPAAQTKALIAVATAYMDTAEMSSEFEKFDISLRVRKPEDMHIEALPVILDGWLKSKA